MPFLIFNLTVFIRNEFFYYKDEHLSAKLLFTSFVVFVNGSLDTCLFQVVCIFKGRHRKESTHSYAKDRLRADSALSITIFLLNSNNCSIK